MNTSIYPPEIEEPNYDKMLAEAPPGISPEAVRYAYVMRQVAYTSQPLRRRVAALESERSLPLNHPSSQLGAGGA